MISLIFRSKVRFGSWTRSGSSSRWRTSCWVIVDAPRLLPRRLSRPADTIASGSNPALSQKVLSSIAVWASMTIGGMSANATTSRFSPPNRASSTAVAVVITDCWVKLRSRRARRSVAGLSVIARERGDDPDGPEQREDREHRPDRERDPAGGGRARSAAASSRLEAALRARGVVHGGTPDGMGVWRKDAIGAAGVRRSERPAERCYDAVTTTRCGVPRVEVGPGPRLDGRGRGVAAGEPVEADQRGARRTGGAASRTIRAAGMAARDRVPEALVERRVVGPEHAAGEDDLGVASDEAVLAGRGRSPSIASSSASRSMIERATGSPAAAVAKTVGASSPTRRSSRRPA